MNPLLNPIFFSRLLKSYITDPSRLKRYTNEKLVRYQLVQLKKIVNYAYKVPVYRNKYKNMGAHPRDIKSINDIKKLQLIKKEVIKKN